jgi:hypothetical protein
MYYGVDTEQTVDTRVAEITRAVDERLSPSGEHGNEPSEKPVLFRSQP